MECFCQAPEDEENWWGTSFYMKKQTKKHHIIGLLTWLLIDDLLLSKLDKACRGGVLVSVGILVGVAVKIHNSALQQHFKSTTSGTKMRLKIKNDNVSSISTCKIDETLLNENNANSRCKASIVKATYLQICFSQRCSKKDVYAHR